VAWTEFSGARRAQRLRRQDDGVGDRAARSWSCTLARSDWRDGSTWSSGIDHLRSRPRRHPSLQNGDAYRRRSRKNDSEREARPLWRSVAGPIRIVSFRPFSDAREEGDDPPRAGPRRTPRSFSAPPARRPGSASPIPGAAQRLPATPVAGRKKRTPCSRTRRVVQSSSPVPAPRVCCRQARVCVRRPCREARTSPSSPARTWSILRAQLALCEARVRECTLHSAGRFPGRREGALLARLFRRVLLRTSRRSVHSTRTSRRVCRGFIFVNPTFSLCVIVRAATTPGTYALSTSLPLLSPSPSAKFQASSVALPSVNMGHPRLLHTKLSLHPVVRTT